MGFGPRRQHPHDKKTRIRLNYWHLRFRRYALMFLRSGPRIVAAIKRLCTDLTRSGLAVRAEKAAHATTTLLSETCEEPLLRTPPRPRSDTVSCRHRSKNRFSSSCSAKALESKRNVVPPRPDVFVHAHAADLIGSSRRRMRQAPIDNATNSSVVKS